ncbi:MAG TPA: EF-hand domain-containing protein [Xanthomonadaceae bacterium]|jgi:Ca2+-binding EF-hand superfamily protein
MNRFPSQSQFRLSPLLVLIVACCAGAGLAVAAPAAKPFWIGDLDTNHDGKISAQEAAAMPAVAKAFATIDQNKDGSITMSEVRLMWRSEMMGIANSSVQGRMAAFTKADTKKAGKISADEAKAAGMNFVVTNFKTFDANHDGFVEKDEMQKGAVALAQQGLAARGQHLQAMFTKADTNKDGKLSQVEFTAAFPKFAPSFAFFDENHDGSVDQTEFALPPGI